VRCASGSVRPRRSTANQQMGQLWYRTVPYLPSVPAARARRCRARANTCCMQFFCPTTAVYCSRAAPYYSTAVSRVSPCCSTTVAIVQIRPFYRFSRFCTRQLLPAYIRKIHYKIFFTGFYFWTFANNSTGCRIRCRAVARPEDLDGRRSGRCTNILGA
jgi:hypothetical protein